MSPQKKIEVTNLIVTTDARSKARIISSPFVFPDGSNGALIVCRLEDEAWKPFEDIKDITINFK